MFQLPYELQRIIYEYDDTYIINYTKCIEEFREILRIFPHKITTFTRQCEMIHIIPKSRLHELNLFIKTVCTRKRIIPIYNTLKTTNKL